MKSRIKIFFISLAATALLLGSCKKVDFGDINNNPNQTTEPITAALLTNTLAVISFYVWDQGGVRSAVPGYYSQYFSQTQYTEFSRYDKTTTNIDQYYAGTFFASGSLYDLQNIINYNTDEATKGKAILYGSNNNQIATARILKAYIYWCLTDLWGDIPYSEALKGNGNVKYDKQETIYPNLLKELTEAVAQFDNGLAVKGDVLYNGNTAKWKKFANSLRMLIALQMAKGNPTLAKSEFAAALANAAGSIETNSDNASIAFPGGSYQNNFYNYYNIVKRDDEAVSKTITDWLSSHTDRRINAYGSSATGFPYGLTRDNAVAFANTNPAFARPIHPSLREESDPMSIVSASQVLLARAEAANLGWTAENSANLYYAGIEQSWREWGVYDATQFNSYKANADVDLAGGDALKKINTQQWLSWYPQGLRGWSTWRRTGYPVLTPAPGMTTIPRRLSHGPNEAQLNPINYTEVAARYTVNGETDSRFAKVWWDK